MFYPNKEEFIKLAKEKNVKTIPVCLEMVNDEITPISIFKNLEKESKYAYLLESVEQGENLGRYTFLGVDAVSVIEYFLETKKIMVKQDGLVIKEDETDDPLGYMKEYMSPYNSCEFDYMPPFAGGAVGYCGYDIVRTVENLPDVPCDDTNIPDMFFLISDIVIAFDHLKHKIMVFCNVLISNDNISELYDCAIEKIKRFVEAKLKDIKISSINNVCFIEESKLDYESMIKNSNFSKEKFKESVLKCKDYIRAGDILQVVLSQRFYKDITVTPLEIYRTLRGINPSPYMFYLKFDKIALAGSSPETMVKVDKDIITTRPIAGTRKRGKDDSEDRALAADLLADEKERAEHVMLVDLGRNDVGKISYPNTVEVTDFMQIEKYSHVMHIVSNVCGKLKQDKDVYDAIKAAFPAGTVSGAPKIRAMQIIDELEPAKRGPYAGLMGYISFSGDMDNCITIRTIVCKDNKAYVQAGAGIVDDSDPEKEYEETVNKAKALMKAVLLTEARNDNTNR